MITKFDNIYRFLSNFYPCSIVYEGIKYTSVEHAYQASKTLDINERYLISVLSTAKSAKAYGNKVKLRNDWDSVKLKIMEELLRLKFSDIALGFKLIETGDEQLVEGNWWGDVFWGVCNGNGENHLGRLLMKIREEIKIRIDIP